MRIPLGLHARPWLRFEPHHHQIAFMTPKTLRDEILRLPAADRLKLIEDIWDSLAVTPEEVPVPDWHKAELDRRLDNPDAGPRLTWPELRDKLHGRDK
jgi:putative addiction module component (TIGR02574 family)